MSPLRARPPLAPMELVSRPIHVLIRDYPEVHAVLLRHGVALPEHGARTLVELDLASLDALQKALLEAMAWRRRS